MSYTEAQLNYYRKNPSHITSDLEEDLLMALIDIDVSWFEYLKDNHTLAIARKAYQTDPSTFKYINREILTPQFLEEVIDTNPMLIQYVYMPSSGLIKRALLNDLNVLQHLRKLPTEIYEWLLPQNGLVLEHIQAGEQTEDLVRLAIHENYEAYKYAHIKTLEFDQYVISQDPSRIDLISGYHPELIEAIIEYNPRYISKFFDKPEIITDTIKRRAIELDSQVYRILPESMVDMNLMKYAVTIDLDLMQYMPYSNELIMYAMNVNGLALKYLRKKDLRSIRTAVDNNVLALDYVPHIRQFLIDYAFKVDGYAIKYLENPTQEQMLDAVQRNGFAIEWIPTEYQTKEIQMYALAGAGAKVIPFITDPVDDEVILEVIRLEPAYIFRIDEPTEAMFRTAFSATGQLMLFYPNWESKFHDEVIAVALRQDGTILEKVKDKTKRLVMTALDSFPSALQWVKYQDLEMAHKAVEADPRTLFFVDKAIMDEELLELAVSLDPDYFTRTEGELTWDQWLAIAGQS